MGLAAADVPFGVQVCMFDFWKEGGEAWRRDVKDVSTRGYCQPDLLLQRTRGDFQLDLLGQ